VELNSIQINWDGEPSGYAENPDNWIFLGKEATLADGSGKKKSANGCFRLHIYLRTTKRQLQNFDFALGMIVWEHTFTALESAPTPYCMLCSLREPMDRNYLGQCTTLFNRTECELSWEARTKMMEN